METTQDYLMVSLKLLGALGLLIFGMMMMSDALQKMAGPQLRHIPTMISILSNCFSVITSILTEPLLGLFS